VLVWANRFSVSTSFCRKVTGDKTNSSTIIYFSTAHPTVVSTLQNTSFQPFSECQDSKGQ
jgi:hypothetical protein